MSTAKSEYTIKCWNDCRMEGCPGHKIKIEYNNTSNSLIYSRDGEIDFGMDSDELERFIKEIYTFRHFVEIDNIFSELGEEVK